MNRLPHWSITDTLPAFYDLESATAIEQTAKLYGAMNTLIESYNEWVDKVNADIEAFENSTDKNIELFATGLRQEFQDFIDTVELKLMSQDKEIKDAVDYMKKNLNNSVTTLLKEIRENGELTNDVLAAFKDIVDDINTEITNRQQSDSVLQTNIDNERNERLANEKVLNERMNTFSTLEEGSTTGDAELMDARTDFKGVTHSNVGNHIRSVAGQLSEEIANIDNGLISLNTDWLKGNYDTSGVLDTSITWRLSTKGKLIFDRDIAIKIESGYFVKYVLYDNDGNFVSNTNKNGILKINAGTLFALTIFVQNESATDNPSNYHTKLVINSKLNDTMEKMQGMIQNPWFISGNNLVMNAEWIQGDFIDKSSFDTTINNNNTNCISFKLELEEPLRIKAGFLNDGYIVQFALFDENKNHLGTSDYTTTYSTTYLTKYALITLKRSDSAKITPIDIYDAMFYVTSHEKNVTVSELEEILTHEKVERSYVITSTDSTGLFEKKSWVYDNSLYFLDVLNIQGRNISVYGINADGDKLLELVNVNTGEKSDVVYLNGKYLIRNTELYNEIKITSEYGYSNNLEVNIVRRLNVPYIPAINKNTKYLPDLVVTNRLEIPDVFGIQQGYAYYHTRNLIYRVNLSDGEEELFYTHSSDISGCGIFDNGNIVVISVAHNNMALLSNGNVSYKLIFFDTENNLKLLPNPMFSYHFYGNKAIICEYCATKSPRSGYKAYFTEDYGETWRVLFDLEQIIDNPENRTYHLHTCVYDNYQNVYWACCGDSTSTQMIYYSNDAGETWNKVNDTLSLQITEIVPMRDCVLFISDTSEVCVYKWQRTRLNGDKLYFDMVHLFIDYVQNACPIGGLAYYDEKTDLAYFSFYTDESINAGYSSDVLKYGDIYVTDGVNIKRVFRDDNMSSTSRVFGNEHYVIGANTSGAIILKK